MVAIISTSTGLHLGEEAWVTVGIVVGILTALASRYRSFRRWLAIRKAKEQLLFGAPAIVDPSTGNVIRSAVPSLAARLDHGDARFAVIDHKLDELSIDVIGRNGKPLCAKVDDLAQIIESHISTSNIHIPKETNVR